jgi:hypothetical protein
VIGKRVHTPRGTGRVSAVFVADRRFSWKQPPAWVVELDSGERFVCAQRHLTILKEAA